MITTAEAVVIGAGSFGSSLAYHLAKQGLRDVVLVDRFEVGAQTSPRAAGLTQQIRRERETTLLAKLSVEKLVRFTEETDIPLEYHQSGSVKMARDDGRCGAGGVGNPRRPGAGARHPPDRRPTSWRERAPWARTDGVQAMWFTPSDLFLEPRQVPQVYTAAARAAGVTVLTGHPGDRAAARARQRPGHRRDDEPGPDRGADRRRRGGRLDAAGGGGGGYPHPGGADAPPTLHHRAAARDPQRAADLPRHRRQCLRATLLGRADAGRLRDQPAARSRCETPRPSSRSPTCRSTWASCAVWRRWCATSSPGWKTRRCSIYRGGLPTMTADGKHIVGPVPGAEGFFAATGCIVGGLSISPGMGEMLAQVILTGSSEIPLDYLRDRPLRP